MMKSTRAIRQIFALFIVLHSVLGQAVLGQSPAPAGQPRPLELRDALAWKRVASPAVSPDGKWFAHKLTPNEGDSEVVLRRLEDGQEWRFPAGESAAAMTAGPMMAGMIPPSELVFADNSRWFAFPIAPGFRESQRLKRERQPLQNRVALIDLETGKKIEFEKIRRFAFSGEQAGWIALHRYGAEPATGPGANPGSGASAGRTAERATGTDLILHELATGHQFNIGNVADFAFNHSGSWLAWTIDAAEMMGNGIQARNMETGAVLPLDNDRAVYRGLNWTEKGDGLAAVKGFEDKGYTEKLFQLVGVRFTQERLRKLIWNPLEEKTFPAGMTISPNRNPTWTDDLDAILFGIHEVKKKKPPVAGKDGKEGEAPPSAAMANASAPRSSPEEPAKPDLVLWHWQDQRLQSQQQVEEPRDRNFSYLASYLDKEERFVRLADESLQTVTPAPHQRYGIGVDRREYERMGNLDGRRYQDLYIVDLKSGERRLALKKNRYSYGASPDGARLLYFEDGHFFSLDLTSGQSTNLTGKVDTAFWDTEDDHNVVKPPLPPLGWTSDSEHVLLSDGWDIWKISAKGGAAANLTVNGRKEKIRYQTRLRLDPEEKGIISTQPIYVRTYGEWTKQAGIARIDPNHTGPHVLRWDDAVYGGMLKARRAEVYLFARETFSEPPTWYSADNSLANPRKLTESNPQQAQFRWSAGSRLVEYTSAKGEKLQGALYLPANYEPGLSYPTIVYIYEKRSQGLNGYVAPTFSGFNKSIYTSNGYAVFEPDIAYKINDPGMSAVWCVLPGLQAAIATGIVNPERVGIHGHSWGGYQTAFLVTQSNAFKAAIAGAPLTDMVSMYNLIYWNTGGGNMSIFESSQGRFTTSPVENPEAYIRNSPVFHAQNVKTPLLILHNDKDGAVDFTQGIEYFNQLRRLQKPVVMLQYKGENHGLRVPANMRDYAVRMKEFFDHHLKSRPAPAWWIEGVPHLKLKDHLEERTPPEPKNDAGPTQTKMR
jgi:dipeptidyl aminopeptidase/acylaminoacyl peptidase